MAVFFPDEPPRDPARQPGSGGVFGTPANLASRGLSRAARNVGGQNRGGVDAKTPPSPNRKETRFSDQPLSNAQKLILVKLAEAAFFKRWRDGARPSDKAQLRKAQEQFRREQAEIACGVWISGATQRHWNDLKAHFEALVGEAGAAFGTLMREHTNGYRQARFKIKRALEERGLDENYAAAIARDQFKRSLDHLSEKQAWCLFFTITNRGAKRARQGGQRSSGAVKATTAQPSLNHSSATAQLIAPLPDDNIPF